MRILAVDPGEVNIGLAVSDPSGTIANPLTVLRHVSREEDARRIAALAEEHQAGRIVIGQALDADGKVGFQARKSRRLAAAIRQRTTLPVELWDESGTTGAAKTAMLEMGAARKKRSGHLDELAAAVLLQDYLDHAQVDREE